MQVYQKEKEFRPITIKLETKEESDTLIGILRLYVARYGNSPPHKMVTEFLHRLESIK